MNLTGRDLDSQRTLFISYSPDDAQLKSQLEQHLRASFLEGSARLSIWTREHIAPGADQQEATLAAVAQAELALLLVSAACLTDPWVLDVELPALLQRRASDGLLVLPVILRACLWQQHPQLAGIGPIPLDGTPVAGSDGAFLDEKYVHVVTAIAAALKRGQASHVPPASAPADQGSVPASQARLPGPVHSQIHIAGSISGGVVIVGSGNQVNLSGSPKRDTP